MLAVLAIVPPWVGVAVLWVKSGVTDGRADRAEARAEEALTEASRLSAAVDRLGDILSGLGGSPGAGAPVEFLVQHSKGSIYTLRNLGPQEATGVTVVNMPDIIVRDIPQDVMLAPMQSHQMFMSPTGQIHVPGEIEVRCDQLDDTVFVPVPPRF